ncbi:AAA family ATPase [Bernardetia sp.]|uniref:AAA family ATPase n=1 Tax=Bernardetia sp. TaxID=1937974 RepID=UPI0025BD7CD8|nr:AAA family ATPase [Bernardetia sp.]
MNNIFPFATDVREIHVGQMTIVYEGIHKELNKKVAIKVLRDSMPSLRDIAKFKEEHALTQNIKSDAIRKSIRQLRIDDRHILILNYIDGQSLKEYQQTNKLSLEDSLSIAIHTTMALQEVHQANVIHKDINPKNIIIGKDKCVYIIDFGIASTFKRQKQNAEVTNAMEGTIMYISPEQTGRVNRSIDVRTDLYSLGITLYELFTGKLPFESLDIMELVHSHIALTPALAHTKNTNIPPILSKILEKLLRKNAEARYQTAFGLQKDLERLSKALKEGKEKIDFQLGTNDITTNFQIPEKLYGREKEIEKLSKIFDKVSYGASHLVLLGGYSGIGKTAIVNELYKSITQKRGYFVKGKFDQFQRDAPYSAIIESFKSFIQQILTESQERIKRWEQKIKIALGINGGVLTEVIPSLELIIGKQNPVPKLGPSETQNRFNLVIQNFVRAISKQEHPLVIFIDDWQWADSGSLSLLELLMTDTNNTHLMLIGTYRDNEVDTSHPFSIKVGELENDNVSMTKIILQPLSFENIATLVNETLNQQSEGSYDLTKIIYQKTQGNPFFTNQFLEMLYDQHLIEFNKKKKEWTWNIDKIKERDSTDNVVELMSQKIKQLDKKTQEILKYASCVGGKFDIHMVASVAEYSLKETVDRLTPALQEGLIYSENDSYKGIDETTENAQIAFYFLHDRVQQAAYSLMKEEEQKEASLKIARFVYYQRDEEYVNEWICDVANYYNEGIDLIEEEKEIKELVRVNLRAARKAKQSLAYLPAIAYLQTAISLLDKNAWKNQRNQTFEIYSLLADCLFLKAKKKEADKIFNLLLEKSESKLEKVRIYNTQILLLESSFKFNDAIELARKALAILDIELPQEENEKTAVFQKETAYISEILDKNGGIGFLETLPIMQNKELKEAVKILYLTWTSCYMVGDMSLVLLTSAKMITLAIQHGNTAETGWAYTAYATFVSSGMGEYKLGYDLGQLSLKLNDKFEDLRTKGPINHLIGVFIHHWRKPVREGLHYLKTGFEASVAAGNYGYAGYAHCVLARHQVLSGINLEKIALDIDTNTAIQHSIKNHGVAQLGVVVNAYVKNLMGLSKTSDSFDNDEFNEKTYLEGYKELPIGAAVYEPLKARMYLYQEDYQKALTHSQAAIPLMIALFGSEWNWFHNNNYSLALCGLIIQEPNHPKKEEYLDIIATNQNQMKIWMENCPENFTHLYFMVEAQLAQIQQDIVSAMKFYDKAILAAQQNQFVHDEALVNELAGKFYLSLDKKDFARIYIQKADYLYRMWGANKKVSLLEKQYRLLLDGQRKASGFSRDSTIGATVISSYSTSSSKGTSIGTALDINTILKASQAISSEIKLENLLSKMIHIIVENAGAEKGYLILKKDTGFQIDAYYSLADNITQVMQSEPVQDSNTLASTVLNYVIRTKEAIILDNAYQNATFKQDSYIKEHTVRSLLCMPIMKQGEVLALLYLENNHSHTIFNKERLNLLNLLSSQIAVSIDNALVYENLETIVDERTTELKHSQERITSSIRYAETIQKAIFPAKIELKSHFTDAFVLFQPKDIVSGDFYWITKVKDEILVAVVDCTGHGVPGAFMSMIGNTLLNEMVLQKNITQPSRIIEALHIGVRKALRQTTTNNRDGMDMVLIKAKYLENGKVDIESAAAKRSLWYTQEGEFLVIKGDRRSVGGVQRESKRKFSHHKLQLNKGECLYLFSDGFPDQSDEKLNKYGTRELIKLLESISKITPLKQQKKIILDSLYHHMGSAEQRDDITLIGIKL